MAKNIGTLVSSAIRPNDSLDPIATAYSNEVRGGLHSVDTILERNEIIFERREWGMLCYIKELDSTYQLVYNNTSLDIMDNLNWIIFNGGVYSEWLESVLSISYNQPMNPNNGDRYILGVTIADLLIGNEWISILPTSIVEWDGSLNQWLVTTPRNSVSIRVKNEDDSIYRFEGAFPGGYWVKERLNQVLDIIADTSNGLDYISTSNLQLDSYQKDVIFLVKFNQINISSDPTININNIGIVTIKKTSINGLLDISENEIKLDLVYTMIYDGINFQIQNMDSGTDVLNIKYLIEENEEIFVPPFHQYWVYDDLIVEGTLINYGQVVIANGSMVLGNSGVFTNFGQLILVNLEVGQNDLNFMNSTTIEFEIITTLVDRNVTAEIIDNSITTNKLSSINPATTGYVLSNLGDGTFEWVEDKNLNVNSIYEVHFEPSTLVGNNQATGFYLSQTPSMISTVKVYLNGQLLLLGDGNPNLDCYFFDGDDTVEFDYLNQGNQLYLNLDIIGYPLEPSDRLIIVYEYDVNIPSTMTPNEFLTREYTQDGIPFITNGNYSYTGIYLDYKPIINSTIQVYVNGGAVKESYGNRDGQVYFSNDGGVTARNKFNIQAGDLLYWNSGISEYELDENDIVSIVYHIS